MIEPLGPLDDDREDESASGGELSPESGASAAPRRSAGVEEALEAEERADAAEPADAGEAVGVELEVEQRSGRPVGDDVPPGLEETSGTEEERAEEPVALEPGELRAALEAVLFSLSEPITIRSLSELFGASVHEVREAVEALRLEYIDTGRSFRIEDIAGGIQLLTVPRYDPWIRKLRQKERESKLSGASLETLAVIAYKQPINKADLESIRGVSCGPTLKTLLDRGLIQVVGREEGLGKPLLYGTTRRFLESFGISSIRELPQPELEREIAERLGEPGSPQPAPEASQEAESASE